VVKHYG